MEDDRKKKLALLSVASILLIAMVAGLVALTLNLQEDKGEKSGEVKTSVKAVCQNTDYKETCMESLANVGDTADPKDLIKAAFSFTIDHFEAAISNSSLMKQVHEDPRTDKAIKGCEELANLAVRDLQKSFEQINEFSMEEFNEALYQLKIWMSGAITYEQTCLDGFEETKGDAGEQMKKLLKKSMELTSNGLAIITDISRALQSLETPKVLNRRLLSMGSSFFGLDWLDSKSRILLETPTKKIKPNLTVAMDGTGDFKTINDALKAIPTNLKTDRFVLYIKEGIYKETVKFYSNLTNLVVIGDGPTKTRITGSLNFIDGTPTYHTATVAVSGDNFIAKDIGFENSAGAEKHQAVALRVSADMVVFHNCHMDGYQDTLYAHTYRQFYRDCTISGTIDFIFGDSAAVFQNCIFVVRKPMDNQKCIVTAQGRKDNRQPTGIVIQNCSFVADPEYYPVRKKIESFLARPWKEYSRTIIMESFIDDLIHPQGWLPWNETFALNTLFYTEFNNRGPGSSKLQRAQWPGVKELPANRIERFTAGKFIFGDEWVPPTGVPYVSGFMFDAPQEASNAAYSESSPEEDRDATPPPKAPKKDKNSDKNKNKSNSDSKDKSEDKSNHKSNDGKSDDKSDKKSQDETPSANSNLPESYISSPTSSPAASPEASPDQILQEEEGFLQKIFRF